MLETAVHTAYFVEQFYLVFSGVSQHNLAFRSIIIHIFALRNRQVLENIYNIPILLSNLVEM